MAAADIRHWQVGDVRVTRIVEIGGFADNIAMLYAGADADWLRGFKWLGPEFVTPEGKMIISFQAFLVRTPSRCIMVDTCIGNDRKRRYAVFDNLKTQFLEDLERCGVLPEQIDTVLCTHLHFDHVGWNTRLVDGKWVPTFPNARHLFGRTEWDHMRHLHAAGDAHAMHLPDSLQPIIDAGLADFIDANHRVCEEIHLIPTPGHTPGHASVVIRSQGEEAVITGDLMHHPVQCAVPDKPANFDEDKPLAAATRRRFLGDYDARRALIIGSHFADPTAGWVERDGEAWRFVSRKD